jgi:hypothetical protein
MKNYTIYIKSNEHPRTINTPMMARTYFSMFKVCGREALESTVAELREQGALITDIRTDLGTRIWL